MYFRLGGGTIKGISKPGHVVWSRIYVEPEGLKADLGLARSIALPGAETERRWQITTPQWPMMHAVLPGITRDQFMARHCSNHIQVAYAADEPMAEKALYAKASMFHALGIDTHFCGDIPLAGVSASESRYGGTSYRFAVRNARAHIAPWSISHADRCGGGLRNRHCAGVDRPQ